jgi:hypothetical protein
LRDGFEYEAGVGEHGNVAAVDVSGGGAHTSDQEALQLGFDGPVVLGHDVPAWLRPPGGAFEFLVKEVGSRSENELPKPTSAPVRTDLRRSPRNGCYNRIDGKRIDLTDSQFENPVKYRDVASDRSEVLADTSASKYATLSAAFLKHIK